MLKRRYYKSTLVFFLMIRRPPRSTLDRSSAASDVYKRQELDALVPNRDNSSVNHMNTSAVNEFLAQMNNSGDDGVFIICLLYTSPSPRDRTRSRMPSSA